MGGKLQAPRRYGGHRRPLRFALTDDPGDGGAGEHAFAGRFGGGKIAVGPALFRQLWQRDEQCCLSRREAARLLAEPGEACRAHALEIAAIGRMGQIEIENLVLAEAPFDLDSARHLQELRPQRPPLARLNKPRHLHGKRRCAGDYTAVGDELQRGTSERQRVDPVMFAKALVLIGDQHLDEARVDVLRGRLQPPQSILGREGAQEAAVSVENFGRDRIGLGEGRRKGPVGPFEGEDCECGQD